PANLPPRIRQNYGAEATAGSVSLKKKLRDYERTVLEEYLERYGRSDKAKKAIARELAISRATLYRKLAELNLS
ncbi:MAG TPA: helix-turn-helix domain-containing protein, partial [Bacillota bacterium]|nr:helix-turn-helix domain-containing protein [Bacillota bacterium]